jgi:hypothetical protein
MERLPPLSTNPIGAVRRAGLRDLPGEAGGVTLCGQRLDLSLAGAPPTALRPWSGRQELPLIIFVNDLLNIFSCPDRRPFQQ